MCILVAALGCHPSLPFICAHNRDEQRDRPSRDDGLEEDSQLLCGRDVKAGGTVLGVHAVGGGFAALTNCRTTVKWPEDERTSRGLLVEFLAANGTAQAEEFIRSRKIDPFHAIAGHIFCDSPEISYFWSAPAEGVQGQDAEGWSSGRKILDRGVFVVSNENPLGETWPKCAWLRREVQAFLDQLPGSRWTIAGVSHVPLKSRGLNVGLPNRS
ncbi:unnamed protein product [Symbiodinium natans]|uniref:Uncharacterized protein n=1 Tax=Symbiodinium natans TaxID=878477 RepID=A0A812H9E9_9DINO|nr:unnamed protein product [Symbiodinium natans]